MSGLRFRQVHLDFHNFDTLPGIGSQWDKKHFQEMLQLGHVDSITVFAKCHHGWCYYPTKVPGSLPHPNLKMDLLGAMIQAAHEIGVRTPAYISAGLDERLVLSHPHWLRRQPDGGTTWVGWMQAGYHEYCLRSEYVDFLAAQVEEVVRNYDADGVFLDIVGPKDCSCGLCVTEMRKRGLDPRDHRQRHDFGRETYILYAQRMNKIIHGIKPGMSIFHNNGHINRGDRELAGLNTHLELESLPTGGWGYDHFPLSARYVQGLGMEFLGMTGKFHTSWGEFGGYKHPNALRFETSLALANGARISVGDQMHPSGRLDKATYRLIGQAYAEVEAKEPWCHEATPVADVALLSLETVLGHQGTDPGSRTGPSDSGAIRVLQEGHILYDVVDPEMEFGGYPLLILPDAVPVQGGLKAKILAYLQQGGKVLTTGTSGLDANQGGYALDLGVRYQGEGAFQPEYIWPRFNLPPWEAAAFVNYSTVARWKNVDAEVLADCQHPYFNRELEHFTSHQHAPSTLENAGPAMVKKGNIVAMAFPAFRLYSEKGQTALREIILHGIRTLLTRPTLTTSLPSQGIQTVMRQVSRGRTVVHLIYGSPVRRGRDIEVIEDLVSIRDVKVALRHDGPVKRVYLAPQNEDLEHQFKDGVVSMTVPELSCHQMVVVEA